MEETKVKNTKGIIAVVVGLALVIGLVVVFTQRAPETVTPETPEPVQEPVQPAEQAPDKEEQATFEVDFTQPAEWTWWLFQDRSELAANYGDYPVVQFFNTKFNATLEFQHPPQGQEQNAFSVMLASGEFTDVIDVTRSLISANQLYRDGVIIDIAKYLDYMPNLKALLDTDPDFRRNAINDDGQILVLPLFDEKRGEPWGGLVYRADIIDNMTDGNPQFPSGNDMPITIEDWEYMLPLIKQYFEAAGLTSYAPLILPPQGTFGFSELLSGFGSFAGYYLDNGIVRFGGLEEGYFNYLAKMREWYEAGYIYRDFATRTGDLFFRQHPELVNAGGVGIWFGLGHQLGAALSMPDRGLNVDVRALPSPIDAENGITEAPSFIVPSRGEIQMRQAVSVDANDIERLLASLDYFYGEEGSQIRSWGLTAEQAPDDPLYVQFGLQDGLWAIDGSGNFSWNQAIYADGKILANFNTFVGGRLPGLASFAPSPFASEAQRNAVKIWDKYSNEGIRLSGALQRTAEEDAIYQNNQTRIDEYVNTMVIKFILGGEPLNAETWGRFRQQLIDFGVEENIAIMQAAYDRFLAR